MGDSTRRFSGRVEDYARYRRHYPAAVLDLLPCEYDTQVYYGLLARGQALAVLIWEKR